MPDAGFVENPFDVTPGVWTFVSMQFSLSVEAFSTTVGSQGFSLFLGDVGPGAVENVGVEPGLYTATSFDCAVDVDNVTFAYGP